MAITRERTSPLAADCGLAPAAPQAGACTPCKMIAVPTQVMTARTRDLLIRTLRIEVSAGPDRGRSLEIDEDEVTVGTDASASLVLSDPTVSRMHFAIRPQPEGWELRDLGSTNGTQVEGVTVLDAMVAPGQTIRIGQTTLRLESSGAVSMQPLSEDASWGRALGKSPAMRRLFAVLPRIAASDVAVLLEGETGTGKTLLADAIHRAGPRRTGPFVVVDCGAVPRNLLEAELFGHEPGAFTDGSSLRIGAFEAAAGGTLLLDEIGELALDLQPVLLRAIDRREIQRIGSTRRIPVDVRIIASTNRDLKAEVNARRFRSDLYFRLAVLVVAMPPLRERTSDIPALVKAILESLGDTDSPVARSLAGGELLPELLRHAWPGNVRELRNYVEACIVRQEVAHAPAGGEPAIDPALPLRAVRDRWIRHVERRYLEQLLLIHGNNVTAAARAAGVDRVHLHRLLSRAGLR
jgi:two-component system response regulator GlrR